MRIKKSAAALAALALLTGCAADSGAGGSAAEETPEVGIAVFDGTPTTIFSGLEAGLWSDLELQTVNIDSGPAAISLMKSGEIDIITDASTPPIAIATSTGVDARVVWMALGTKTAVVGAEGIASAEDLRGATIGTVVGSVADFVLVEYLEANGLTAQDVNILNVPGGSMRAAMQSGQIDAAVIWDPVIDSLLELPGTSVLDERLVPSADLVSADFAEGNPEAVQRWVCGRAQAADDYIERPDEAQAAIGAQINLDAAEVAGLLIPENVYAAEDQSDALGADAVDAVVATGEWLADAERIDAAPDRSAIESVFDASFAQGVLDGACKE
jgi:ABC-type nitrate/sulfonate/bicarbonate transport system substrate-binding protein